MKKLFFFIPVIFLIFATTVTKNSTKQLDKKIFEIKENLRVCDFIIVKSPIERGANIIFQS